MTIFTRHKVLNTQDKKEGGYVCDRNTTLMIEQSWKHVLAIARNQMDEVNLNDTTTNNTRHQHQAPSLIGNSDTDHPQHQILLEQLDQRRSQQSNEFYDRERLMVQALDTLFSVACDGSGYIDFLATMVQLLDPDCPVSMAFLSHVIDRATLPSRNTMSCVSAALISKLNVRFNNIPTTMTSNSDHNDGSNSKWASWIGHYTPMAIQKEHRMVCEFGSKVDIKMKRNVLVIWSILAEKFAGDMVQLLWTPDVANILFYFLSSNAEDWTVRVFALLALEKFALTGDVKTQILQHPLHIQNALRQAIYDSKYGTSPYDNTMLSAQISAKSKNNDVTTTGLSVIFQSLRKRTNRPYIDWISTYMHKLGKRKQFDQSNNNNKSSSSHQQHQHECNQPIEPMDEDQIDYDDDDDDISRFALTEHDENTDYRHSHDSWVGDEFYYHEENSKSTLLENSSKESVMKRMELAHCAEWSLGHTFANNRNMNPYSTWDLARLNVIANPYDATQHWKIGSNGLELRNDRLYFESIRATACVKKGRWYYEVLLVTEGIMQIGWCTNKCRFVPEEGYGVGDDQHGFAFDTYRCAVWANGSAVYPQQQNHRLHKCRAGDVLGSYLDLDQGICSFFVNGKDLGLTVAFEHASSHNNGGDTMEGLYPAFSLTTHQHILVNFGDQPWMYLPDRLSCTTISQDWKGFNQAGSMDHAFRQQLQHRLMQPVHQMGNKTTNASPTSFTPTSTTLMNDQVNDDWDGPLCTMCFDEPKDTILIPCGHGTWGAACTKVLVSCPLCRSKIEGYSRQDIQMK
ncbi:hypothetical protein BC941DRAFT_415669 [Chlamydoabsidia padenii]|nr:hypothetical protein BC941DRAFT_415669 [Chlamydoabsidia padenii]